MHYYFEKSEAATNQKMLADSSRSTPATLSNRGKKNYYEEEWIATTNFDAEMSATTTPT